MSRFQIHDELSAPDRSIPVLRGALSGGGQLPNLLGVLAGAPAVLRGYARFRSELRHGTLGFATLERIGLAIAQRRGSQQGVAGHMRAARALGIGVDEIARARCFESEDPREAAMLRYIEALERDGRPPMHLHEEAREAGWEDEQLLEAVAAVALESFTSMVQLAGDIPLDHFGEDPRVLRAA